jgi:hypothetical protein
MVYVTMPVLAVMDKADAVEWHAERWGVESGNHLSYYFNS